MRSDYEQKQRLDGDQVLRCSPAQEYGNFKCIRSHSLSLAVKGLTSFYPYDCTLEGRGGPPFIQRLASMAEEAYEPTA